MSRRHRGRPRFHAPGRADLDGRGVSVESSEATLSQSISPLPAALPGLPGERRAGHRTTDGAPGERASGERASGDGGFGRGPMGSQLPTTLPGGPSLGPTTGHLGSAGDHIGSPAAQGPQTPGLTVPLSSAAPPYGDRAGQCTSPQLRRFIKSRPYVPMHELRRRFGVSGDDDDVTPVRLKLGQIFVGLPTHEGRLLGELLRSGEIGYELSLDPITPIVIGVYPMRPIPRN